MDSMYLDNLDEFINDEKKIITYKWLSLSLDVSANMAKQMLYHYVTDRRNSADNKNLHVTYLVSGKISGLDGGPDILKVSVVRESGLESIKSEMKEIVSVHVYSVQSSVIKDLNVLYSADYDKVKEHIINSTKHSGVKCDEAQLKSCEDLKHLQQKSAYKPPPEQEKITTKGTLKGPSHNNDNKISSSKNVGIASMFKNQTKKPETKKSPIKNGNVKSNKSPVEIKKSGGMAAFLTKGPPPKKIKTENVEKSEDVKSPIKNTPKSPVNIKKEIEEVKIIPKAPKTYSRQNKNQKTNKTKSKKESEDPLPKHKRKRILLPSDSESSEEEEEEDDEAPLPSTPPPNVKLLVESESDDDIFPATPQDPPKTEISKSGRFRRQKLVNKTFTDDDGFLVTKKVHECISGSESDENPLPPKIKEENSKPTKPISPKTNSTEKSQPSKKKSKPSPTKTKQSSITSFFKKK